MIKIAKMDCNFTKKSMNLHCKINRPIEKKTHLARSTVYEHSNLKFKSFGNQQLFWCSTSREINPLKSSQFIELQKTNTFIVIIRTK